MQTTGDPTAASRTDLEQLVGILGQFDRADVVAAARQLGIEVSGSVAVAPGGKVLRASAVSSIRIKCRYRFTQEKKSDDYVIDGFDKDDCEVVIRYNDGGTQAEKIAKTGVITRVGDVISLSGLSD